MRSSTKRHWQDFWEEADQLESGGRLRHRRAMVREVIACWTIRETDSPEARSWKSGPAPAATPWPWPAPAPRS